MIFLIFPEPHLGFKVSVTVYRFCLLTLNYPRIFAFFVLFTLIFLNRLGKHKLSQNKHTSLKALRKAIKD